MSTAYIKPRDIVRTPSGRDARVIEVLPEGRRRLEYLDDYEGVELPARLLYVVQAAPALPWGKLR